MNILYLHQYFKFPDESGGTRSYDLSKRFVEEGHTVNVVTTTSDEKLKNGEEWTLVRKDGINVHYIYLPYDNKMSYSQRIKAFLKFIWLSSRKISSLESDVVIATSTPLTIGIPALLAKWRRNIPFIFEVRDVWPQVVIAIGAIQNKYIQKALYKLEYIIYKNATSIVALSSDMKASIVSRYPNIAQNKKIEIIENIAEVNRFGGYNPNEESLLSRAGVPKSRYIVLYAGTFGKVNGLQYVIPLAEKTIELDPSLIYVLVGDGKEKEEIIETAKSKNILNKNLFILDSISKDELPLLYSEVDMGSSFVSDIPELWANSANKFFDTLAAGKPILINYGGWQKDTILKENIGYVLPVKLNDASIVDFVKYTKDSSLQSIQQQKAKEKAIASYSLDIAVKKYNKLLKNV